MYMKKTNFLLVVTALIVLNTSVMAQNKAWNVPDSFKSMKNPVTQNEAAIKAGLAVFTRNCVSCHGKTGQGNGIKASTLRNFPGDFSRPEFQNLTDGEILYRVKTGKDEMPKFEGKLTDDEIWNVINYLRTLKR
jgi:mono/diheme cytochrome c family protein